MHARCFLIVVLALLFLPCGVRAQDIAADGLQLHLDFNGNANDKSGNGYHGIPRNITYTTGTTGEAATAAVFNGVDGSVEVPGLEKLSGKISSFTLLSRIWVDHVNQLPEVPAPYVACYSLFWWHAGMTDSMMGYLRARVRGVFNSYDNGAGGLDAFYSYNMDWCTAGIGSASSAQTPLKEMVGRWITFSMVYDQGSVSIYVDCRRVHHITNVLPAFSDHCYGSPDAITIGQVPQSVFQYGYRYFQGKVDDFRIYTRALSEDEVMTYANPTCVQPRLAWEITVPDPCFPERIHVKDKTIPTAAFVERTWLVNGEAVGQGAEMDLRLINPGSTEIGLVYRDALDTYKKDTAYYYAAPGPLRFLKTMQDSFRVCEGQGLVLAAEGAASYQWDPCPGQDCSGPLLSMQPAVSGNYRLTGQLPNGCADTLRFTVQVIADTQQVWIPDAFTPNNDGRNDRFGWISRSPLTGASLRVYNRWGQQVFDSGAGDRVTWDGRRGGQPQPAGTYVWKLRYRSGLGCPEKTRSGRVELLR